MKLYDLTIKQFLDKTASSTVISAGIDYNYNLMIFSIGSFDIIINPTEYVNRLNNGITYKSILFPNGDFGYGLCNVEVDKYSLIVAEKYEN